LRPHGSSTADDDDLAALGGAVRAALATLLAAALVAGLASVVLLSLLTPEYAARAQIEIVARAGQTATAHLHKEAIATHVRALQSSDFALRLAASLGLAARPEFTGAPTELGPFHRLSRVVGLSGSSAGGGEQDRVLDAYYRRLHVEQVGDAPAIAVEFRSADPSLAAEVANKLVELYRDELGVRAVLETLDGRAGLAAPLEVRIASRAGVASERVWPKTGMVVLLAMVATLLVGSAVVAARELLAVRRRDGYGNTSLATAGSEFLHGSRRSPLAATARTLPAAARQLIARAAGRSGFRTLVAGATSRAEVGAAAAALARELARRNRQVILLDWSLDGVDLASALGVSPRLGITDVLSGRTTFEDVIERLAGSDAHVIAAGSSAGGAAAAREKDRVNMLLDALDDTYEHVVITGERQAMRDLFTTIDGRFDLAVVVGDGERALTPGNVLGFHVADLDVIRYEPVAQRGAAAVLTSRPALV
jgi:capsular polysaccharide biosynthesis protein